MPRPICLAPCTSTWVKVRNVKIAQMFGSFSEETLSAYNDAVKRKKKETKPSWMDNAGIGSFSNDFEKTGESMMKEDYYAEHDYAECLRTGK